METDFFDAFLKVLGAFHDVDFNAHEVDGQITPVQFGKTNGILLSGDQHFSLTFHTAINDIEHLLLVVPMVIRKPSLVNNLIPQLNQALLDLEKEKDRLIYGRSP